MPIFEATEQALTAIPVTSFATLGFKERGDLQRLLAARIEAVEEGLLVLAEEFADWTDSARRIDLLCLDREARLVVVELKRDEEGGHMELQALRYAAMVSTMTFEQASGTLARRRSIEPGAAREAILAHLGWAGPDEGAFAQETRIILAAADFGKEITTTVLWLRTRYALDIRCVRLRPHRTADGRVLLDIQTLIPLPEAADIMVKIRAKQAAEQKERSERAKLLGHFLDALAMRAAAQTNLHLGRTPNPEIGVLSGPSRNGFNVNYVVGKDQSRVELLIQRDDGAEQMARLREAAPAIEAAFGDTLAWLEKDGVRQRRISRSLEGGYSSDEAAWPGLQGEMIAAMIRLEAAIRPYLSTLS